MRSRDRRRVKAVALSWTLLLIVAIVGILLSVGLFFVFERQSDRESLHALTSLASDDKKAIESRMSTYLSTIYGFKSFFESSDFVSRQDFDDYYTGLDLSQRYPGFDAISYVRRVPYEEREAIIAEIRNDSSAGDLQSTTFDIKNGAIQGLYYPIQFVEPLPKDTSSFGIDLSTLPERYEAIRSAERSGQPIASVSFKLLSNGMPGNESGFLISLPVNQRGSDKVIGFVNAVFNYDHFFSNAIAPNDYAVRFTDDSGQTIYSNGKVEYKHVLHVTKPIKVAGKTWHMQLDAKDNFAQSGLARLTPYIALIASLVINLLVTGIMYSLLRSREAAVKLAMEITEDLRNKEARHELMINSIRDYAIFMLDAKGKVTSWNNGAEHIKGYTADEVIGKYIGLFYPKGSKRTAKKLLDKASVEGRAEHEGWRIKKDGTRFWAGVIISAVRDLDGKLIGFVKVTRDLTERKRAESERDSFIAIAIHELRTPLTSAIAYIQVLQRRFNKNGDKSNATIMGQVDTQLHALVKLVSDLTDAAKIDNEKFGLTLQSCNINLLVTTLIEELQQSYKTHKLVLEGSVTSDVMCDDFRIRQVLTNLIDNAVKYSPAANTVVIKLEETNKELMISVRDYGLGIAKKDYKKIFQRYYRVRGGTNITGFGLGLYLSADIMHRHKGRLWVRTSSPEGSEIVLSLPLHKDT